MVAKRCFVLFLCKSKMKNESGVAIFHPKLIKKHQFEGRVGGPEGSRCAIFFQRDADLSVRVHY